MHYSSIRIFIVYQFMSLKVIMIYIKSSYQSKMLKKSIGITRNRFQNYTHAKLNLHKKKNRFKYMDKDEQSITQNEMSANGDQLLSETTRNSSSSQKSYQHHSGCVEICQQIKDLLQKVNQIKKRMTIQAKARYSSFKQSQTKQRDQNICKLSKQAVQYILLSEKRLNSIRSMKGKTMLEQKYYRNMQMSLSQQIRQGSKQLRNQQKQYFDRLKTYERGTVNNAIQLNTEDRQKMRSDLDTFQMQDQKLEEKDQRSEQIQQLVKSINQLTTVYRELNEMVIHQGSLIDRIDFNIEETYDCMIRGNQHLVSAEKKAQYKIASKCIKILLAGVVILAIVLAFKYSSGSG